MRPRPPFSQPFRYVELPEATEMVQHYFGGYRGVLLDAAQRAALEAAWARVVGAGISLTPAQLEELCAEYESVAALCAGLERLAAFRLRFRPHATGPVDATDMALIADLAHRFPVDRHAPAA